ncbi:Uncharacterised protein [Mycobacteroides abscessus subsp. abscessus]|nr:Uncharacterised protein [Mycobacteroides abscessus subsp. abscessus]SIN58225.1 Uncharacterised protein [Mycobacteroides abscessus subsp. abscessus]
MRVNGGVDEVVSAQRLAILACGAGFVGLGVTLAGGPAQHAPATASGNLAQLLDVDVHQVTGTRRLHSADDPAGGPVQPAQFGQSVTGQDPMHGGWMHPEQITDTGRAPTADDPDFDDPPFGARRGLIWAAMWP